MTTRDTPFAPGTPCWIDLASSDVAKTNAFYTELFGWTAQGSGEDFGNYVVYSLGGSPVAGAMPKQPGMDWPDAWSTYIATDDCAATVDRVKNAGGQIIMDTTEVPETGTVAVFSDPSGAVVGAWQGGGHTGFGRYNEPGSVTWDELNTKEFKPAIDFYATVFGWDYDVTSDSDDFRYYTAKVDGDTVAGVMDATRFLPPEAPSHWGVYFSVASVDDAVAKAQELGGSVVQAPEDTPHGRIAIVADSTGAYFRLHQELAGPTA
jgi:predicted enzyme related to lactoylglutathione lyase